MSLPPVRLALLVTGASGMLLPKRFLEIVLARTDVERLHLVVSRGGSQVLAHELGREQSGAEGLLDATGIARSLRERVVIHRDNELDAAISSGSYRLAGTVVLPCSGSTLASFATGAGATLVGRAGAVALKERWPLLLGFRETPLSIVHLENLRLLAWAGALVVPPIPAFYLGGDRLDRFVDAYCHRLVDHLRLPELSGPHGACADLRWPPS